MMRTTVLTYTTLHGELELDLGEVAHVPQRGDYVYLTHDGGRLGYEVVWLEWDVDTAAGRPQHCKAVVQYKRKLNEDR